VNGEKYFCRVFVFVSKSSRCIETSETK
jgi:hypothetical protein